VGTASEHFNIDGHSAGFIRVADQDAIVEKNEEGVGIQLSN